MSNRFSALIVLWAVDEVRLVPVFQMTRYYGASLSNLTVLNSYLNFSSTFSRCSRLAPCTSSKDRNENPLVRSTPTEFSMPYEAFSIRCPEGHACAHCRGQLVGLKENSIVSSIFFFFQPKLQISTDYCRLCPQALLQLSLPYRNTSSPDAPSCKIVP